MKKFLFTAMFPVLLATFMSVNFASCGSDDEDEELVPKTEQVGATNGTTGGTTGDGNGDGSTSEGGETGDGTINGEESNEGTGDDATNTPSDDETTGNEAIDGSEIINGHEAVDLGLPSGVKWASCNVGASSPEEYGGYYAWGETEEKYDYSWSTYKHCNGRFDTITKYCTEDYYGIVDNKTTLDPEDDVAHVKWGGNWRMPTYVEQKELKTECIWSWTTLNGVNGYEVTGPNGNSIFLPAAGHRYRTEAYDRGSSGYFWSSLLYDGVSGTVYFLYFQESNYDYYSDNGRCCGHSVRPVCP